MDSLVVQQDGARPHTGKGNLAKLNAAGSRLPITIEVRTQPAQSPDLNICDLAFFRALKCAVRKRRRPNGSDEDGELWSKFDVEKLVGDVLSEYDAYPSEKLEDMWAYKQDIMKIVSRDGKTNQQYV